WFPGQHGHCDGLDPWSPFAGHFRLEPGSAPRRRGPTLRLELAGALRPERAEPSGPHPQIGIVRTASSVPLVWAASSGPWSQLRALAQQHVTTHADLGALVRAGLAALGNALVAGRLGARAARRRSRAVGGELTLGRIGRARDLVGLGVVMISGQDPLD